tara:strand:- start:26696 stop:27367 length:672 start_codon:yes stop_codon:yes gene_type:complete
MTNYVVAMSKDWFNRHAKSAEYKKLSIFYIQKKEDLSLNKLDKINPKYIFFPHWSWIVQPEIFNHYECVVFHTAPLPYGRGGSPIQNLILNGFKKAPVCALKMSDKLDAGPIYNRKEISLDGNLDKIFTRIAKCIDEMIIDICTNNPIPLEQEGEPTVFKRLTYKDNEIKKNFSLENIYDRIRMVDGVDYKNAYIDFGEYRIDLTNADIENNEILAKVRIVRK